MIHNRHLKISPKSLLVITYSKGMRRVFQERFKDYTELNNLRTFERRTAAMYLCFFSCVRHVWFNSHDNIEQ
jgi:hypothetical protein